VTDRNTDRNNDRTNPPRRPRPAGSAPRREGTPVTRRPSTAPSRPRAAARPAGRPPAPRPPRRVTMGRPVVRLRGGLLAVLIMLSLIGGRLVWLQGFQAEAYASEATKQRLSTVKLAAPRGSISDRNGQVLALSVDARAVYGEPRTIAKASCPPAAKTPCEPKTIATALAPVLGLPADEIESKLILSPKATGASCSKTDLLGCKGFAYLARGLEAEQANKVRDLGLVGIGTVAEPRRVAPAGEVAANVLGFTTVEGAGTAGVEDQFDSVLAGKDGKRIAEVDGGGRIIPNGYTSTVEPEAGRDVQLTIDRDLQWYAQKVLADTVREKNAESGSATLMDIRTGEVLALATVPTFNADQAGKADAAVRGNRAVSDVFEPGSIGKAITAAAVLEAGVLTPDSVLSVPWQYRLSNKTFKDSHAHAVEQMTYTGVLVESSNVGTIMAAEKIGGAKLHEMLTRFGIGKRTGIELPGESPGILRDEKDEWSGTDYGTHPIGQGYAVNGVQMASVYATIANGGLKVKPTILKATTGRDGSVVPAERPAATRVISQKVADQLRGMLEGVTNEGGTAVSAAIDGYRVAGKTGTAQRAAAGGGYGNGYTASFVGFAPADAPRLVLSVSIQDPKNGYYGGLVAGPPFSAIMKFALRSMQEPPTGAPSPKLRLRADDPY
jgi:cell division protein FtsI (penicillin-binding protein 3)